MPAFIKFSKDFNLHCTPVKNLVSKDFFITPVNFNVEDYWLDINDSIYYDLFDNKDYNDTFIPEDKYLGEIDLEQYRVKKHHTYKIPKVKQIPITIDLITLLGYLCRHGECTIGFFYYQEPKCLYKYHTYDFHLYMHMAYKKIFKWIIDFIKETFKFGLRNNQKYMVLDGYTTNHHLANTLYQWSSRVPNWLKALPAKVQLYIFRGIFYDQLGERNFSFRTDNLALFYDLITILNKNYIYPVVSFNCNNNKLDHKYQFYIKRVQSTNLVDFLFYQKPHKIDVNNLTGTNIPVKYNGYQYLKYPIKIENISTSKQTAVKVIIENDHFFLLNNFLTKCD